MNQHYFDVPFAFAGDVTPIPDPLQTGGTVSFTEGWNFNYQRDLSTDPAAEPIDRSTMNWLLLQITQALQAIQNAGVPEFITAAQNGGASFPYGKGTPVLWSASGNAPFGKYVSLTAGNTNTPDAGDPQGLTTGWQLVVDPIATAAQAAAGTDDASIMTPLKVAQQTALRALLAGNASQVFNVGPAVSATQAPQLQQVNPGRLLRRLIYTLVGGVLMVSVNGSAFTTTGATAFVPSSNATLWEVEGCGGGGGSGGLPATSSTQVAIVGGGGSGAYARSIFTSMPASVAIAVGAPGAAGASGGGSGGVGGVSTFGTLITCNGGGGSPGSSTVPTGSVATVNVGAVGGAVSTGGNVINSGGTTGTNGYYIDFQKGPFGGIGASSPLGQGGNFGATINSGSAGTGFGAGAGGRASQPSSAAGAGLAGAPGCWIVKEYA